MTNILLKCKRKGCHGIININPKSYKMTFPGMSVDGNPVVVNTVSGLCTQCHSEHVYKVQGVASVEVEEMK